MKKKTFRLLCFLLALLLLLVSCSKAPVEEDDETDAPVPAVPVTLFGGDDDFQIIFPEDVSVELKKTVASFREAITDAIGVKPQTNPDQTAEAPKELLIGNTNRAQSATSLEALTSIGYRIAWIDGKLVVSAANDYLLGKALTALFGAFTAEDGKLILQSDLLLEKDCSDEMQPLVDESGAPLFTILAGDLYGANIDAPVNDLVDAYRAAVGKLPSVEFASAKPAETKYEILIGQTGRPESNQLIGELGILDYKIAFVESKLVVAAVSVNEVTTAIRTLSDSLMSIGEHTYYGAPSIPLAYTAEKIGTGWQTEIPQPSNGICQGIHSFGDGTYIISYAESDEATYDAYLTALSKQGYTQSDTYTLENNRYALLSSKTITTYVSYIAATGEIRVFLEKAGNSAIPTVKAATEGGGDDPSLWFMEQDWKGSQANSGLTLIFRLSDGTFLIWDGGYTGDKDRVYEILRDNTPVGQKPVVSGWFITHAHTDHYQCLVSFSEQYAKDVEVKAFYYNFERNGVAGGVSSITKIENAMKKWTGATRYSKLHTGMTLGFADATATVICTQEDVFPNKPYDGNDTNTVIRLDIGGQRIMILGDACYQQSKAMSRNIPASVLKSDIVQIAHHGYEGCLKELYEAIGAKTALWPMNIYGYKPGATEAVFASWVGKGDAGGYPYPNAYLISEQSSIEKFFISGMGTSRIDLPYTPSGDRMPDYKAKFNEIKQNDPR